MATSTMEPVPGCVQRYFTICDDQIVIKPPELVFLEEVGHTFTNSLI